ncbi:MAG: S8 family serine peptidase [Gemmatimonadaceae bacterium]|nr:S8 family serine peptidase [Gemmatimonadaceae bacterium]
MDAPLSRIGGKGLFTREIEEALLDGRIDLAVHSIKDLPTEVPEGLEVGAIPVREEPWDALVSRDGRSLDALPPGARVGTSSLRRRALILAVRGDNDVAYVEQVQEYSIDATQNNATWGLDRIDQANLPLNGTYSYTSTGSGVRAYIIDTGIRTSHNDFGGRASFGVNYAGGSNSDCNGHGTHVAGTVGGTTWGVAKAVRLIAVKVLNCSGSGTTTGVVSGINWVAANAIKPAVANMSLGGGASTSIDNAVQNAINAGITFVVAAGNSNANACNYSPARAANAITVGATTSTDARASYSNYGTCVDIFAPGSSIRSAWHTSNSATNTISGTSMASPHVAGAVARYLQGNPTASPSTVTSAIINAATLNKVTNAGAGSPNRLLYVAPGS